MRSVRVYGSYVRSVCTKESPRGLFEEYFQLLPTPRPVKPDGLGVGPKLGWPFLSTLSDFCGQRGLRLGSWWF